MYATEYEYKFTVREASGNRTDIIIELAGEFQDERRLIGHEFALLDYVLTDRAKIELAEIEAHDHNNTSGWSIRPSN